MEEQRKKAVAQDKALVEEYEAKLERLRKESEGKLAAERERMARALADKDEAFRKLQVEDQAKFQKKCDELAQVKAQAKQEMERLAAEGLAAITALEIQLTDKIHRGEVRMAEMEKEFL